MNLRKWTAVATAALLAVTPVIASAEATKNEIVYATYNADGSNGVFSVVNRFDVEQAETLKDYGTYEQVTNLTSTEPITVKGDAITVHADEGVFYYEGTLSQLELPWSLTMQYYLNGTEIAPSELAGQRGTVEIVFGVKRNAACTLDYFDHYALSVTMTFNTENCTNIKAPNGILANVGKSKQISYTIVPQTEEEYHITMYASQFAMDAVTINGVPMTIDVGSIDTNDAKSDLTDLEQGAIDLDDGANELADGVDDLEDGADELYTGSGKVSAAMRTLGTASATLDDGVTELGSGIYALSMAASTLQSYTQQFLDATAQLTDPESQALLQQAEEGLAAYASALSDKALALNAGATTLGTRVSALPAAVKNAGDLLENAYQILAGVKSAATSDQQGLPAASGYIGQVITMLQGAQNDLSPVLSDSAKQQFAAAIQALGGAKQIVDGVDGAFDSTEQVSYNTALTIVKGVADSMSTVDESGSTMYAQAKALDSALNDKQNGLVAGIQAYTDAVGSYSALVGQFEKGMNKVNKGTKKLCTNLETYLAGAELLYNGAAELQTGYDTFKSGATSFTGGVRKLAGNYQTLDEGVQALVDGVDELAAGVVELTDGTNQLRDRTSGADTRVDDEVDKALDKFNNDDYVAPSFVSDKNTPEMVQFVIKLRSVELPKSDDEVVPEETVEESPLDRLKDLFSKKTDTDGDGVDDTEATETTSPLERFKDLFHK